MRKPAAPTGKKRPAAVWRAPLLIASVLAAVGALMLVHHVLKPADAVYMTVDGTAVGSEELRFYLQKNRAAAVRRFADSRRTAEAGFWDTPQDGVAPIDYLIELATDELRQDHALFADAARLTDTPCLTFRQLCQQLEEENARREQGTFYGVQRYTPITYLDHVKSNLILQHKMELKAQKGSFSPDEATLEAFYNSHRTADPLFCREDGSYKSFADVRAKVAYLYEQEEYRVYLQTLLGQQRVEIQRDAIRRLAESMEEQEEPL